jgi:hypothetical protein
MAPPKTRVERLKPFAKFVMSASPEPKSPGSILLLTGIQLQWIEQTACQTPRWQDVIENKVDGRVASWAAKDRNQVSVDDSARTPVKITRAGGKRRFLVSCWFTKPAAVLGRR